MENTVIGVYDSYAQADNALNELLASGFSRDDARLSSGPGEGGQPARSEHAGESGIGHFFRTLFGMEEDRPDHHDIYTEALQRGSCVLSVDARDDEQRERAIDIMNRYDPVDIEERAESWRSQGWTGRTGMADNAPGGAYVAGQDAGGVERTAGAAPADTGAGMTQSAATGGERTIPVVEEQLKVGKREVERGGVRVYQRVRETPVEESVQLREEHVSVDRRKVDQPASEADLDAFKEGTLELRETAEEPVVSKSARVVEEVVVGKDVTQHTEDIKDTVRKTEVDVQPLDATRARTDMEDTTTIGEDSDYRDHWRNVYGQSGQRYEDYDSAYRYGAGLGAQDRFRNYRWEDVEGDVRSDWESSHPGSTWERVKEAVRYGAERGRH